MTAVAVVLAVAVAVLAVSVAYCRARIRWLSTRLEDSHMRLVEAQNPGINVGHLRAQRCREGLCRHEAGADHWSAAG